MNFKLIYLLASPTKFGEFISTIFLFRPTNIVDMYKRCLNVSCLNSFSKCKLNFFLRKKKSFHNRHERHNLFMKNYDKKRAYYVRLRLTPSYLSASAKIVSLLISRSSSIFNSYSIKFSFVRSHTTRSGCPLK